MTTAITRMSEEGALTEAGTLSDEELDDVVRGHLQDAIMVGAALTVRRERGTWKSIDGAKTWEEFCRDRYGITRVTAWRRIQQARATDALPEGSKPPSQRRAIEARSVVRPEPTIPPPSGVEPPTAEATTGVEAPEGITSAPVTGDGTGEPLPPIAEEDWDEMTLLRSKVVEQRTRIDGLLAQIEALRTARGERPSSEAGKLSEAALYLPALVELDAAMVAYTVEDTEARWKMARRLRRWCEQFEMASRGFVPPAPRSETVTPRLKDKGKG